MQDDHQAKAAILWRAFKQRLNTSVPTFNLLSLDSLIEKVLELVKLDRAFTKEEIDAIVKDLPFDKAPGLDGFNTDFIKHCWDILASDFYALIEDFCHGRISLQSINSSFITLIPKKDAPTTPNDFRPISLLN